MKYQQFLLPAVTAAIGFSIAWISKPGTAEPGAKPETAETSGYSGINPRADNRRPRSESLSEHRPTEVRPGDFPLANQAEQGPKTRAEGKMLRLTEALGLSLEQQGAIIKAVEDSKKDTGGTAPVIQDLTERGQKVEQLLAQTLTPEQLAKFQEIQERERDNRIEARAQRSLLRVIEEIDLSPGQRDAVLARLRLAEKEKMQAVPAAATLLLSSSVLPTDPHDMTIEGVMRLNELAQPNADNPDDAVQFQKQLQKRRLEEKLRCFDGIFSPGQMGQYHAILSEEKAITDRLPTTGSFQPPSGTTSPR